MELVQGQQEEGMSVKMNLAQKNTISVVAAIGESPCYGNERPEGTLRTVFIRGNSRGEKSGQVERPGGTL